MVRKKGVKYQQFQFFCAIFVVSVLGQECQNETNDNVIDSDILSKRNFANETAISSKKFVRQKNAICKTQTITSIECNSYDICMVDTCPINFYDKMIAYDCETTNKTELLMDFRLSLPVTSTATNITYKNAFCAYCNGERHYTFWDAHLRCEMKLNSTSSQSCSRLDFEWAESVLSNLKINDNYESLISTVNGTDLKCQIYGDLPPPNPNEKKAWFFTSNETDGDEKNYTSCELCIQSFPVDFHDQRLPRFIFYNITDSYIVDGKIFSKFMPFSRNSSLLPKNSCFSMTDGEYCQTFYIISSQYYHFVNDKSTIFVPLLKAEFGPSQWYNVFDDEGVVFVCITVAKNNEYFVASIILLLLKGISIFFFLVLLRVIGTNEEKRQSLPNQIVFSYSITVLTLYFVDYVSFWLPWCKILGPLLHYLKLSSYAWLSILAYDFWRMICYSSNSLIEEVKECRAKRFSSYCLIGWILPLSIVSVAVYFESTTNGDIPCEWRPAYSKALFCQMTQKIAINWFNNYPIYLTLCIVVVLFLHSSYYVMFMYSKHKCVVCGKTDSNFCILMKLAWTMGLAFVITFVSYFFENSIAFAFGCFDQPQGIIIYFIHGCNHNSCRNTHCLKKHPSKERENSAQNLIQKN